MTPPFSACMQMVPPFLPGPQQRPEDARVVQHEDAGVGHEQLERRDALADERVHLLFHLIGQLGDDHVEPVVDGRLPLGLLHPRLPGVVKRLPLVLNREVDDRGGAAVRRGDRAGLEVVGRRRAAERHVEVRVHVDPAREDVLAGGIDDAIRGHRQRRPDRGDLLLLDEDVSADRDRWR